MKNSIKELIKLANKFANSLLTPKQSLLEVHRILERREQNLRRATEMVRSPGYSRVMDTRVLEEIFRSIIDDDRKIIGVLNVVKHHLDKETIKEVVKEPTDISKE